MKKVLGTAAAKAVLAMLATACNKETDEYRVMRYSTNVGVHFKVTVDGRYDVVY